jgi:uncharacterized damage-inducible protein DinB
VYTKDAIRFSLNLAEQAMLQSLAGIEDKPLIAPETTPTNDAAVYPSIEKVRARYLHLRAMNLQFLDSLSEADLDKATPWQPKGVEEHFATYGKALLTLALHQTMHRSHITDAIRSAGRAVPAAVGAEV